MIVSYCDAQQRNYSETIDAVAERLKKGRYDGVFSEANGLGGIIADQLEARLKQANVLVLVKRIRNSLPKNERIDMLSDYIRRGQLLFANDIQPALIEELDAFPFSERDDCLDALASIVLELRSLRILDVQLR
jgi:phage terminase large subunit-like protein